MFTISVKRPVYDFKNLLLRHSLHISVNNRVISTFHEGFAFTKLRRCEVSQIKTLVKVFNFTVSQDDFTLCILETCKHVLSQTMQTPII